MPRAFTPRIAVLLGVIIVYGVLVAWTAFFYGALLVRTPMGILFPLLIAGGLVSAALLGTAIRRLATFLRADESGRPPEILRLLILPIVYGSIGLLFLMGRLANLLSANLTLDPLLATYGMVVAFDLGMVILVAYAVRLGRLG